MMHGNDKQTFRRYIVLSGFFQLQFERHVELAALVAET